MNFLKYKNNYSFGSPMPSRSFSTSSYKYGYQGSEKDNEVNDGVYSTYNRILDVRLGKWFTTDPKIKEYESPYSAMSNNPLWHNDILGDDIPTKFDAEATKTADENGVPQKVQDMFNKEYGLKVKYENGSLTYAGEAKTDLKVSQSARKILFDKLQKNATNTGALSFISNSKKSESKDKSMLFVGEDYKGTTTINLAAFESNLVLKGKFENFNGQETRSFNLARVFEHEYIGHNLFGDDDNSSRIGETETRVNNFRKEMGLGTVLRLNYVTTKANYIYFGPDDSNRAWKALEKNVEKSPIPYTGSPRMQMPKVK